MDHLEPEPKCPAMIVAPNHPSEPPLLFASSPEHLSELLDEHFAEPPSYWPPCDRIIDRIGRKFRIFWSGKNFFEYELVDERATPEECRQFLLEYHQYIKRNPRRYLDMIDGSSGDEVIAKSITFLGTLPRHSLGIRLSGSIIVVLILTLLAAVVALAIAVVDKLMRR